MSISKLVKEKIKSMPEGSVVTFEDFNTFSNKQAVALSLGRLKKDGFLQRLDKGRYFIPRQTKFGKLGPTESTIIESLLKSDGASYISGVAAYNKLGLTTQVPNEITIVGKKINRRATIGRIKIKYVKAKAPISKENIPLLQILDAISSIKKIPDITANEALRILKNKIKALSNENKILMIRLSQYYRPCVKAILASILEEEGILEVQELRVKMNPLTVFRFNFSESILPLKSSWNLI